MADAGQGESFQATVSKELTEAISIDEDFNETCIMYCQWTNETVAQGNQRSGEDTNGKEIETNQGEIATNVRPNAHLKNVHKKPAEMESYYFQGFWNLETKNFGLPSFDWTQWNSEANTSGDTSRIFVIWYVQ